MLQSQQAEIKYALKNIFKYIGDDPEREGLQKTPDRVIKAWGELFAGYKQTAEEVLGTTFSEFGQYDSMILLKDIDFMSFCIPGYQMLSTGLGVKPARNVAIGDTLWTLENGVPCLTTVTNVSSYKAPIIAKIELENGKKFDVTSDHPIMTINGWEEAGNLQKGDLVEYINPNTLSKKQYEFNLGYDLGYVVGAVASDGSIQDDRRVCLEVNELWFAEKYKNALKAAFGLVVDIQKIEKPSGYLNKNIVQYRVRFVSSQIAKRLLKLLGLPMGLGSKSKTKKFHFPKIMLSSKEMMSGFLDGYIDGDGTPSSSGSSTIISSNLTFLQELGSVIQTKPIIAERGVHTLRVSKHWDRQGWYLKHGFEQQDVPLDIGESDFVKVKSVILVDKPTKVYSFKTGKGTFLVSGVLTHNCEHHFLAFQGKAHIAYIPADGAESKVVGLSKLARLVDMHAKRLQIQEKMTADIAADLNRVIQPAGVGVVVEAHHSCMGCRGIKKPNGVMVTSSLLGSFKDNSTVRNEFMQLLNKAV